MLIAAEIYPTREKRPFLSALFPVGLPTDAFAARAGVGFAVATTGRRRRAEDDARDERRERFRGVRRELARVEVLRGGGTPHHVIVVATLLADLDHAVALIRLRLKTHMKRMSTVRVISYGILV